jgi:NAD(P)-dependent dehydrogenase (short-subunit alcohol dehydrogenase family)
MGIVENDHKNIFLIGGSGGVGQALIGSDLFNSITTCIPTYLSKEPDSEDLNWKYYDSRDISGSESAIKKLSGELNIDMIIDASGAFFASSLAKTTYETIRDVAFTNFIAPLALSKMALEHLAPSGKIVFLSSVTTQLNIFGSSVYAASKSGLEKSISLLGPEFERNGLAICGIRLGYMDFGMTYKIAEEIRNDIKASLPDSEFLGIKVLADLLQSISHSNTSSVNGKIFEINRN